MKPRLHVDYQAADGSLCNGIGAGCNCRARAFRNAENFVSSLSLSGARARICVQLKHPTRNIHKSISEHTQPILSEQAVYNSSGEKVCGIALNTDIGCQSECRNLSEIMR